MMTKHACPNWPSVVLFLLTAAIVPALVGCPRAEQPAVPEPEAETPAVPADGVDRPGTAGTARPAWVPEATPPRVPAVPPDAAMAGRDPEESEPTMMPAEVLSPNSGRSPAAGSGVSQVPGPMEESPLDGNPLRRDAPPRSDAPQSAMPPSDPSPMAGPPSDPSPMAEPPSEMPRNAMAPNGMPQDDSPQDHAPRRGKKDSGDFDPVAMNGPIFVDWPKPKVALIITGCQNGYMEPCGCAGLDRMKGGMSRRHSLFRELREKRGWPTVGLDAGGIARGYGKQAELKFHIMVDGMRTMGYDAVALGAGDLRLPTAELVAVAASTGDQRSMFLSANVGLFGFDAGLTATHRIIEQSGVKLAVTGVLGAEFQKGINNSEIEFVGAEAALRKLLPILEPADFQILLAHATMAESEALARQFPEFDIVITAGGAAEPPAQPRRIEGTNTLLVEVGEKGMDAVVLGLYDAPNAGWRYQRVPLDSRFAQSPDMHMLMTAYQHQVQSLGFSGLGIRPAPHPLKETHGELAGSKSCETCHEPSYRIWRKTPHARAYQTLVDLDPPRQFDPECISCHVIGWHPTQYFPYEGGYKSLEETPHLIDVGCESCHGPGGNHNQAELRGTDEEKERYRKLMVVTKEESRDGQCATCHDLDNSPDFDFDTYWPEVEHYEDQ